MVANKWRVGVNFGTLGNSDKQKVLLKKRSGWTLPPAAFAVFNEPTFERPLLSRCVVTATLTKINSFLISPFTERYD
jgi:hypothetical protein